MPGLRDGENGRRSFYLQRRRRRNGSRGGNMMILRIVWFSLKRWYERTKKEYNDDQMSWLPDDLQAGVQERHKSEQVLYTMQTKGFVSEDQSFNYNDPQVRTSRSSGIDDEAAGQKEIET